MTSSRLVLNGLTHYWRTNLAVVAGVAVAVTVLAGALIVGDSVRGSLRDLVLQRLGTADLVIKPMTALSVEGITGTARSAEGELVLVVGLSFLMDGCRSNVKLAA